MKVWVVIEEDRGYGVSICGVYDSEEQAIKNCRSNEYVSESEFVGVSSVVKSDFMDIHKSRYAHWNESEKRSETWEETVERCVNLFSSYNA